MGARYRLPVAESCLHYVVEAMPPSRLGRRWRWALFEGERLLAAGWRLSERRALLALRAAAGRVAHEPLGLHPLRPETGWVPNTVTPGVTLRLQTGPVAWVLAPLTVAAPGPTAVPAHA